MGQPVTSCMSATVLEDKSNAKRSQRRHLTGNKNPEKCVFFGRYSYMLQNIEMEYSHLPSSKWFPQTHLELPIINSIQICKFDFNNTWYDNLNKHLVNKLKDIQLHHSSVICIKGTDDTYCSLCFCLHLLQGTDVGTDASLSTFVCTINALSFCWDYEGRRGRHTTEGHTDETTLCVLTVLDEHVGVGSWLTA